MYIVIGYDHMFRPTTVIFDSFVKAAKYCRKKNKYHPTFMMRAGDIKSCMFVL